MPPAKLCRISPLSNSWSVTVLQPAWLRDNHRTKIKEIISLQQVATGNPQLLLQILSPSFLHFHWCLSALAERGMCSTSSDLQFKRHWYAVSVWLSVSHQWHRIPEQLQVTTEMCSIGIKVKRFLPYQTESLTKFTQNCCFHPATPSSMLNRIKNSWQI